MRKQFVHVLILTLFYILVTGIANGASMILKSPADIREYDSFFLENGLQVLLISDPSADKAAAALDIRVGQFQDPVKHQGMAHFLEHMLFLGTKKYPIAGEFGSYLSAHGGGSNAYTSHEDTNYHFSVQTDFLEEALDRFAQFFIAPTFDPAFVEREVNAVNSEHQKNIKNDWRRMYQILREVSNPKHPFSKFGTGNLTTLWEGAAGKENLRELLIEFYKKYYSSNLMKLTISGKEDLNQLKKWAILYFSEIPNKNLKEESFKDIPVIDAPLPRKIYIQPIKATRTLRLMFPAPSQREYYLNKPEQLISRILGDESRGSVLSLLKQKNWAMSLSSGTAFGSKDFSFFDISITLTKEGLNHIDEISAIVFQAISLIKSDKNQARYFEEMKKMAKIEFQFLEKVPPFGYVTSLSSHMHDVPINHVLASNWTFKEYNQKRVDELLSYIRPSNLQMVLAAPDLKTNRKEKWYETPYRVEKIKPETLSLWLNMAKSKDLSLPAPNPFIPEKVALVPTPLKEKNLALIVDEPGFRIWYKQDEQFKVPKGNLRFIFSTPKAYSTVKKATMTKLYTMLLRDALNELTYPASVAGLHYSFTNSVRGLEISLSGYSENIELLFEKILEKATHLEVSPEKFKDYRNQILEERQNQKLGQAYHRSMYEMGYLTSEQLWHTDDYLEVIEKISLQDLKQFIPDLLSNLNIEALAHGNFSRSEIEQFGDLLLEKLGNDLKKPAEKIVERTINLPESKPLVYQLNITDINSSVNTYYQAGPVNVKQTVTLDMIKTILEKPFYHQLRTIEQLGYLVWSGYRNSNNVEGMYFLIQSGVREPVYLQSRIEQFLSDFEVKLTNLSKDEFEQFKASLIKKRQEPPKKLSEATARFWDEISSAKYDFQRREKEIEALEKIKLSDVVSLFQQLFLNPNKIKKLTVQTVGTKHKMEKSTEKSLGNPRTFKKQVQYYANPEGDIRPELRQNKKIFSQK